MCCGASIFAPLYNNIVYVQFTWDPTTIHMMHLAVCSYYFFFCPSFYSRSFGAFHFLSDIVNNLIHYYYYFPDTWCIVIAMIGAVYRERPLRQSPLSCPRGLFSPQSLGNSPLGVILSANDRRPIATDR